MNIKQQNFGNVKQLQKDNPLFNLIYKINQKSSTGSILNYVLIITNTILNIIIFLSLKQINILKQNTLVLESTANLVFLGLMGLIILQLLLCYFYQIQFFICIQWKTYRYMILPFILQFLLSEVQNQSFIKQPIAITLFMIIIIISLILTAVFSVQSYVYKKLLHRDFPINWHLLIIEIFFHIYTHLQNDNLKITCILIIVFIALVQYKNNFTIMKEDGYQYRLLAIQIFMFLWFGVLLLIAVFGKTEQIKGLMMVSLPCLCYKVVLQLVKQRAPVPYKAFCSIFEDPDTIKFQDFIDSIQPLIQQIMDHYYSQQKKDFVNTLLISYYYQHSNRCLNVECPFKNQDYKTQLKNMNDSKNMKQVLFKICKKIDYIYYGLYKTWPQNIDLKLSLIQFYIFCYPNKIRALQIVSQMDLTKLSIQQQYQLFKINVLIQNMATLQVAGQIKYDQKVVQFENLLYCTLNTLMQFWMLFSQQKIDFNKLINITSKIFPLRQKIQEIFNSQLQAQTYSSLQILRLYTLYCLSIQNDEQKSFKLDDYIVKLKCRLQQHKQIQYLSFQSDIGLVALSLSQNKLGNIQMVNNQACNIFNYTKKQFKCIRVNQIMPRTFSQQHDNILKTFLQNRFKKINTDQRYLYGKCKEGFIFPISLQLQRTVSTANEELLFIGNIKKNKMKQAILSCITDEEGELFDVSSTFYNLLLRQDMHSKQQRKGKFSKNIQQFIPQFFNLSIEQDQYTREKHFINTFNIKYYQQVKIDFTITPIIFPLKPNGGFLVQGRIITVQRSLQFPQLSISRSFNRMLRQNKIICHKIFYDHKLNKYLISKQQQQIINSNQIQNKFTLPFINIQDVKSIFDQKNQQHNFANQIKTIRLVKEHFQRVQQMSQFQSQYNKQSLQLKQTKNQIIQLKQSILKDSHPVFLSNIKIFLILLSLCCIIICFLLINLYYTYTQVKIKQSNQIQYKYQTRGFLSQYIVYFTAQQSFNQSTLYQPKILSTRNQLINSIQKSPIFQIKKQKMLKIIYLQNQSNLTQLLNDKTLKFQPDQYNPINKIFALWYGFYGILAMLIIVSLSSYFLFLNQLESIYQVFMCLEEKVIKKMYINCKKLANRIENPNQKVQDVNAKQTQFKIRQSQYNQDQQENPVKKVRKFKTDQKLRSLFLFIQLLVPFIIIILITIVIINLISLHDNRFCVQQTIYREIFQLAPQSSIYLMNTFLLNSQNISPNVTHNFEYSYQQIQQMLFEYEKVYRNELTNSYFSTLFNNVCKESSQSIQYTTLCKSISQGSLTVGLSKAINYIASYLKSFQHSLTLNSTSIKQQKQRYKQLILLQYQFIFPLIILMTKQMLSVFNEQTDLFEIQYTIFTIIIVFFIIVNYMYFIKYPAAEIQEKIKLSKDLIQLLPEFNNDQRKKKGYNQINQIQ